MLREERGEGGYIREREAGVKEKRNEEKRKREKRKELRGYSRES